MGTEAKARDARRVLREEGRRFIYSDSAIIFQTAMQTLCALPLKDRARICLRIIMGGRTLRSIFEIPARAEIKQDLPQGR